MRHCHRWRVEMKRIMILLGLLAAVSHAGIVVTAPPSSASTAPAAGAMEFKLK